MEAQSLSEVSRLHWQCRRGMKELDVLLEEYLRSRYPLAGLAERQAFQSLLEKADPVLWNYVLGREQPPLEEERRVIQQLRRTP